MITGHQWMACLVAQQSALTGMTAMIAMVMDYVQYVAVFTHL